MATALVVIISLAVGGVVGSLSAGLSARARAQMVCLENAAAEGLTRRQARRICRR